GPQRPVRAARRPSRRRTRRRASPRGGTPTVGTPCRATAPPPRQAIPELRPRRQRGTPRAPILRQAKGSARKRPRAPARSRASTAGTGAGAPQPRAPSSHAYEIRKFFVLLVPNARHALEVLRRREGAVRLSVGDDLL